MITITVQAETPDDSGATFRVLINGAEIGAALTVAEAHLVVSKSLQRIAQSKARKQPPLPSPVRARPIDWPARLPRSVPVYGELRGSAA